MACNLTLSGLQPECMSNSGGIKKIWAIEFSKIKNVTFNEDMTEVTAITLDASAKMLSYAIRKESTQLVSEYTIDESNGIKFATNTLNVKFPRIDASKRMELIAMISGEVAVLAEDANGTYYFLGSENPVTVSAASADSGTARTDANSYTLALTDFSGHFAPIVSKAIVDSLLGTV